MKKKKRFYCEQFFNSYIIMFQKLDVLTINKLCCLFCKNKQKLKRKREQVWNEVDILQPKLEYCVTIYTNMLKEM